MWQRKQTIYLILAFFLMSIAAYFVKDLILDIVSCVVALLSIVTIFMFKNRQVQMRMCFLGQVLLLLWVAYFSFVHFGRKVGLPSFQLCFPIVSYLMFRMARIGIKHDEELVRSADRIR